jgi:DNA-damage-inducible protein D
MKEDTEISNFGDEPDSGHVRTQLEKLARIHSNGEQYWLARDLMDALGYENWQNLQKAIERAEASFEKSGGSVSHHITAVSRMVEIGSGAKRSVSDYALSRKGAYLIAMNGDPRKQQIAEIQQYFAEKARFAELHAELAGDASRVAHRKLLASAFATLNSAAKSAGVHNFGIFNGSGLRGMYELSQQEILDRKALPPSANLYDHVGTDELSLNAYRATLAKSRLTSESVHTQDEANRIHFDAGREVRRSYMQFTGTAPEDLPTEENIKKVERRVDKRIVSELKPNPKPMVDSTE